LESRLVSRFGWGLTIGIEPPELEMRVAILLKKAAISGYTLNDAVAFFIAKHVNSNVRELEGALKRVEAYTKFHKRIISVENSKRGFKGYSGCTEADRSPSTISRKPLLTISV